MKINISLKAKIMMIIILTIIAATLTLTIGSITNAERFFVGIAPNFSLNANSGFENSSNIDTTNIDTSGFVPIEQFRNKSIVYMIIVIVIGIAVSYVFLGKSLKPLIELSKAVSSISEKNLSHRIIGIKTNDEVGNLAHSFNGMLDKLDKSFNSQKQFTANAAHELKTPLAIMQSSMDVLKLDKEPNIEGYKENLEYMEQSVKSLVEIVNELLLLARDSEDCFTGYVKINHIVDNVIGQLDPIIKEKEISVSIENAQCEVLGNERLLYHLFFNLVENAIKYNKHNGTISIIVTQIGDRVKVEISDTGIGMTEEELVNIFDPFYCIDKSRSKENGGYGLGLSLVKSIIEKQNGEIRVTSELGKGTSFFIIL